MKTISNKIIRKFKPCYDPSEVVKDENEELPVVEWVQKYRNLVHEKQDIIWLLCREDFMSNKDIRLFAVWCAREALKLIPDPDKRCINACDVAEKFAHGEATEEELTSAMNTARDIIWTTKNIANRDSIRTIIWSVVWVTSWNVARDSDIVAARNASWTSAWAIAKATVGDTNEYAIINAAWLVAIDAQIDKLLTYFE